MNLFHSLSEWALHYGGAAFFPLMFVNGAGMPLIPAESLLAGGAVLAEKGKISFAAMVICAYCGTVLGSLTGYFIGRFGGAKLVDRLIRFFRLNPQKFAKFEAKLRDKGVYFILIARFLPVARELNGLISGSIGMSLGRFMLGNCLGAFLWVLIWSALPYLFGREL